MPHQETAAFSGVYQNPFWIVPLCLSISFGYSSHSPGASLSSGPLQCCMDAGRHTLQIQANYFLDAKLRRTLLLSFMAGEENRRLRHYDQEQRPYDAVSSTPEAHQIARRKLEYEDEIEGAWFEDLLGRPVDSGDDSVVERELCCPFCERSILEIVFDYSGVVERTQNPCRHVVFINEWEGDSWLSDEPYVGDVCRGFRRSIRHRIRSTSYPTFLAATVDMAKLIGHELRRHYRTVLRRSSLRVNMGAQRESAYSVIFAQVCPP